LKITVESQAAGHKLTQLPDGKEDEFPAFLTYILGLNQLIVDLMKPLLLHEKGL
jgi:hypothetical protein